MQPGDVGFDHRDPSLCTVNVPSALINCFSQQVACYYLLYEHECYNNTLINRRFWMHSNHAQVAGTWFFFRKSIFQVPDFRPDFPFPGTIVPHNLRDNPGTQKKEQGYKGMWYNSPHSHNQGRNWRALSKTKAKSEFRDLKCP